MAIKQIYFPAFIFIFLAESPLLCCTRSTYHKPCFWIGYPLMIWKTPQQMETSSMLRPRDGSMKPACPVLIQSSSSDLAQSFVSAVRSLPSSDFCISKSKGRGANSQFVLGLSNILFEGNWFGVASICLIIYRPV